MFRRWTNAGSHRSISVSSPITRRCRSSTSAYLGVPATLTLDWDDPWYSKFDNRNLKRHHKSALMSYLYVEPYEVRHEVLTRVRDLEAWMDLGLRDARYIEADEWAPLQRRVEKFLLARNRVRIDGKPVKPILDRSNYVTVSLKGIRLVEKPQRLEVSTAIVGVILAYVIDGMPQEVTVDWELFTDQVQRIPATATDPAGPLLTYLEPGDNVHRWQNFLKNYAPPTVADIRVDPSLTALQVPVAALVLLLLAVALGWTGYRRYRRGNGGLVLAVAPPAVLLALAVATLPLARVAVPNPFAGAPVPPPERAKAVLEGVFTNIYRAFDFRDEEAVYDKLAVSVAGEKLSEIYLQNRQALVLKNQGGRPGPRTGGRGAGGRQTRRPRRRPGLSRARRLDGRGARGSLGPRASAPQPLSGDPHAQGQGRGVEAHRP